MKSGSNSSANVKLTNFRGSIARDPIPTNTLLRPSSNQQTVPLNFNFLFFFFSNFNFLGSSAGARFSKVPTIVN